jgi:hypothetical protein
MNKITKFKSKQIIKQILKRNNFTLVYVLICIAIILSKRIKIPSPTIAAIQEEMRRRIERENSNSAIQCGTHVEPLKAKPGQDTVSEQTTPETLLPP